MRAALEEQTWDLVISDFSMPEFSGPAALAVCQEKGMDIPFIVVSGRIGEEIAVEMMKAGADDYVSKDNLGRLVPAVSRELRALNERRRHARAEGMMAHLAAIVESCDDAIISKTLDGVVLSWNSAAERIYGYAADEMLGRSIAVLQPEGRAHEQQELDNKIKHGQRVERFETVRVRKDGKTIDVSLTLSPIKDADGRIVSASIVVRDITERKHADNERLILIQELTDALARVNTLRGLLPICASCKKIRNDDGYWEQVETYIKNHSNANFTHGICPDCMKALYPGHVKVAAV
jgi:PAS domain S-box-containing protein